MNKVEWLQNECVGFFGVFNVEQLLTLPPSCHFSFIVDVGGHWQAIVVENGNYNIFCACNEEHEEVVSFCSRYGNVIRRSFDQADPQPHLCTEYSLFFISSICFQSVEEVMASMTCEKNEIPQVVNSCLLELEARILCEEIFK